MINKRAGGLGSWQTGRKYPNDCIAKNGQNPETSPGHSSEKSSANTDVKNSKGVNNDNNLFIAPHNNAIRTNCLSFRIKKTQVDWLVGIYGISTFVGY